LSRPTELPKKVLVPVKITGSAGQEQFLQKCQSGKYRISGSGQNKTGQKGEDLFCL
jgi:hypothetical protein